MENTTAYGSFAGPLRSWSNKHIIIPAVIDKDHQHYAETVHIFQSVSALNDLVKTDTTEGVLAAHWPPNMVAYYSTKLWPGWVCHDAWQEIPKSTLVEVLDSVRNITLRMALEVKEELGTSYTDLDRIKPEQAEKAKTVVINNLGGNVAFGNMDASGQTIIIAGDRKTLDTALTKAGLDHADLSELTEAILNDGGTKPGTGVTGWIKAKKKHSRSAHFAEFPARFQVGRTSQNCQLFFGQTVVSILAGHFLFWLVVLWWTGGRESATD